MTSVAKRIVLIDSLLSPDRSFEEKALALYEYQADYNPIYRQFINIVRYNGFKPKNVSEIPFLPIALFKSNIIKTGEWEEEVIFHSSGTTGIKRSKHYVRDLGWYRENAKKIWESHFDPLAEYSFLSLLPSYHEQPESSLLYMIEGFIEEGSKVRKYHFINDYEALYNRLNELIQSERKIVLFGVSFALLDYVRQYQHTDARNVLVVETGGMKKKARAITREALHRKLMEGFKKALIVSEYGMTECLSQMYSTDNRTFMMNEVFRAVITDPTDPGSVVEHGQRGKINLIDLANVDSIGFIGTEDLGMIDPLNKRLHIMGRLDNSDVRGCNYLL